MSAKEDASAQEDAPDKTMSQKEDVQDTPNNQETQGIDNKEDIQDTPNES